MSDELTPYDPAQDLTTDQAIVDFMSGALETNDPGFIAHALGIVARARGMARIASEAGLSREQVDRTFDSHGDVALATTLAILKALGIKLSPGPSFAH